LKIKKMSSLFVGVASLVVTGLAAAALPLAATTAFTDLGTAVTDVIDAVWPLVAAVLVGFMTIKLVKKGVSRAG
jgi:hypothetical protein